MAMLRPVCLVFLIVLIQPPAHASGRWVDYRLPPGWTARELPGDGARPMLVFSDEQGRERVQLAMSSSGGIDGFLEPWTSPSARSCQQSETARVDVAGGIGTAEVCVCDQVDGEVVAETVRARISGSLLEIRFTSASRDEHDAEQEVFHRLLRGLELLAV